MQYSIFIPTINPLHFIQDGFSPLPQYNSKHIEDYQMEDAIRSWEQTVQWFQPWQKTDRIRLQLHSQLGPVNYEIINRYDDVVFTGNLQQIAQSFFDPSLYVYELDLALTVFDSGYYRMKLKFGSPVTVTTVSNWFEVSDTFDDSLLIEYKHFKNYADAYFESGWSPSIRIYGTLKYEKPGSVNTLYENQENDMTLLNSKPYSVWRLYTGGPEGIPDWGIIKYNIIFGCSDLKIDGRYHSRATDGGFEERAEQDYPMRGWSIELRDKLARTSKILTSDGIGPSQNNLGLTVVINVESKGFVSDDAGGSYYELLDIE